MPDLSTIPFKTRADSDSSARQANTLPSPDHRAASSRCCTVTLTVTLTAQPGRASSFGGGHGAYTSRWLHLHLHLHLRLHVHPFGVESQFRGHVHKGEGDLAVRLSGAQLQGQKLERGVLV
ncbi:unnamed protein product [Diplocarpon coronariae]|uniref:Uncharacterized protein n=1 Tax=Diplocarpon coronariae TaxID=2795749 RepID=A0A218ZE63_9HELO|nr:hypothetical protein JHW43_008111 [Diplocarpon mali]OWP06278.1 hypothetical protein B2J93_4894 [Marssonina coronariae]